MQRLLRGWICGVGVVLVSGVEGVGQSTRYRLDGTFDSRFGAATASIGDVNQDGYPDLAIGAPLFPVPLAANAGCAHVVSGFNGAVLHRSFGDAAGWEWGRLVANVFDVDGDGVDDVAVGGDTGGSRRVRVYSGATGDMLREWIGPRNTGYPDAIVGLGDVDADGFDDVAVSAPSHRPSKQHAIGVVFVYSGRDGSLLRTISMGDSNLRFAQRIVAAGDVDADGVRDLLLHSFLPSPFEQHRVTVMSGRDIATIWEWTEGGTSASGALLAGDGDINGDGVPDLIVGRPNDGAFGRVLAYSGRSGRVLFDLQSSPWFSSRPLTGVMMLGDQDGDGFAEFGFSADGLRVCSGFDARVLATVNADQRAHGAGDIDGDGFDELVVPRIWETFGGPGSGSVYVLDLDYTIPVDRGSFTTFGDGCVGTVGVPRLSADPGRRPVLGSTFVIELDMLPATFFSTPFLLLGVDRVSWQGLPLPFDLAIVGAPSCDVLTSIDVAIQLMNVGGTASWSAVIPNRPELMGQSYFVQGLVLDPPANVFGAVLSNGGAMRFGQP